MLLKCIEYCLVYLCIAINVLGTCTSMPALRKRENDNV